jgi:isoquinoline 1-oxidoreductase beta subunit
VDIPQKTNGSASFGIDTELPDMLYATTVHCPVFGGRSQKIRDDLAKKIPGVHEVFSIDNAVAVVAEDTWTAMKAAKVLDIQWDEGAGKDLSSESIRKRLQEATQRGGEVTFQQGDVSLTLPGNRILEASYDLPFQAHVPMEPMNCTAWVTEDGCKVWAPTQSPSAAQETANQYAFSTLEYYKNKLSRQLDIDTQDTVEINTTLLGGGFGRRLQQDYVAEAVQIAKKIGKPVKLTWTREEDIQHDFYHPYTFHRMAGRIDDTGKPVSWLHRLAGVGDPGASDLPYAIPNAQIEVTSLHVPIPTGPWRSVSHHYYAFAQETFFDELARFGKQDPLELRLALLQDPRMRSVLDLAADKAGWGETQHGNHFIGLAVHKSFGTYVAEAVEVAVTDDGQINIPRVVVAIDCGIVINPDIVAAQMESSVVFALSAALNGPITLDNGRVMQSNFHDSPLLRFDQMPEVETHMVKSTASPQGIGEPGVPPFGPALANAVFAATDRPVRKLPMELKMPA